MTAAFTFSASPEPRGHPYGWWRELSRRYGGHEARECGHDGWGFREAGDGIQHDKKNSELISLSAFRKVYAIADVDEVHEMLEHGGYCEDEKATFEFIDTAAMVSPPMLAR
ncbi:hypothetical protein GUJ93_ZPchr0002g24078 [Zizania palustris]|uniref:Uncharacterized protein n=1 Tax=Zizania palustris TaxID=103762 RepID=A0A8J5V9Q6_ZIZPA|nr:hypothetical protein GUJ93_ZPchr0002g24078 [Zizania palustris]